MSVSTQYFYVEDVPGQSYDNLSNLVEEILVSLAANGNGILPFTELQLIELIAHPNMADDLYDFLSTQIDSNTVGRPHAYMTYIFYDERFTIVPGASKVLQVQDPNDLRTIADLDVEAPVNGYLHAYVSNGSSHTVNFDNFMITYTRGNTRQFNEYYPYGLSNTGLNGYSNEYPYKYQGKEYQSGEWNGHQDGIELYDFDARFYEPALARWFVPDPATARECVRTEQFHNPYLAMGNNPVMYMDPDGEWVHLVIGAVIGGTMNAISNAENIHNFGDGAKYFGIGAAAGALGAGVGAGVGSVMAGASFGAGFAGSQAAGVATSSFISGATIGTSAGFTGGFVTGIGNTGIQGGNIGQMIGSGLEYGWKGAASGAVIGGISGGVSAVSDGRKFWSGKSIDKPNLSLRELNDLQASIEKMNLDDLQGFKADFSSNNDFSEALKMYRAHRLRDLNQMPTEFGEFIDTSSLQDGVNGWKNKNFNMFWVKEWQTPAGTITLRMQPDWSRVVDGVAREGSSLFIYGQNTGITWPDLSQFIFNNNSAPMYWNYVNNGITPKW